MKRTFAVCATAVLIASLSPDSSVIAQEIATVSDRSPSETGLQKPGFRSKADSSLGKALAEYREHVEQGRPAPGFKPTSQLTQVAAGSIVIDARASEDGAELLADLIQLGLTRGSRYGDIVSGLLPLSAVDSALALPSLRSMTASPKPITHAGSINSQGDAALRADIARTTFGVDGSGVTVGVVSDSYDTLGGAANDILSGDLPVAGVPVLNGESALCGVLIFCIDEGRAMLQIVHDMAPGADLLFQTGIDGIAAYANAITNLQASGADIIVDDLLILNEPMFQDGIVAQAVDTVVANGSAYFSAAGNSGRQGYSAPFDDSGEIFCIEFFDPIGDCDPLFERVGRMHDFDPGPGVDNYMHVTIPVNTVMTIAMQWDQPFGGVGPDNDHDIVLLDETGATYFTISANDNIIMGEGWEALQFDNSEFLAQGTEFAIIITYDDVDSVGPPANLVKFVIFGTGIVINEWATNDGAMFGHPNAAGAEAVGAAFFMDTPANGTSPPVLQPYSAAGGTPILFDVAGTRLAAQEVRQKPEITAVDGVNTTFFFDDSYGSDGIDDFFGTSAAAPHAAGVAALLLEANPSASPAQIYNALQNTAIDMGTPGIDQDSGHGLIQTDAAITAVTATFAEDMNGDSTSDILWLNSFTDQVHFWGMHGANITDSSQITVLTDPAWAVAGQGDYNGDGYFDTLWRHAVDGRNYFWQMDGSTIVAEEAVPRVSNMEWQVVGDGDYDGDGMHDILWWNSSNGVLRYWQMNGSAMLLQGDIDTIDLAWSVAAGGDFNDDGYDDILLRNSATGQIYLWHMNGSAIQSGGSVTTITDLAWDVASSGDYNGDGMTDILLRHGTTGQVYYWQMNGPAIAGGQTVANISDASWVIVGSGDYNGDGKSDILLHHGVTGQVYLWQMDGGVIDQGLPIANIADLNWAIIDVN